MWLSRSTFEKRRSGLARQMLHTSILLVIWMRIFSWIILAQPICDQSPEPIASEDSRPQSGEPATKKAPKVNGQILNAIERYSLLAYRLVIISQHNLSKSTSALINVGNDGTRLIAYPQANERAGQIPFWYRDPDLDTAWHV